MRCEMNMAMKEREVSNGPTMWLWITRKVVLGRERTTICELDEQDLVKKKEKNVSQARTGRDSVSVDSGD